MKEGNREVKMKTKNKNTAASVLADICDDQTLAAEVERELRETRFATMMVENRVKKGLTQKDIADRMGVSPSTVSRLENSRDAELQYGEVESYLKALDLDLSVTVFDKNMSTTDWIKYNVFEIQRLLEHLTAIAKKCNDDPAIVDGITKFRGEVLFNFLVKYQSSGEGLPVFSSVKRMESDALPCPEVKKDSLVSV